MDKNFFDKAAGYLPDVCFDGKVALGLLLGSGWNKAIITDNILVRIPYRDIPGLGDATIEGHTGEFILYERNSRRIAAWCGRRHFYEGVGWEQAILPIEILRRMGVDKVVLTNASGGINPALRPGDFVIIRDHINLIGMNPLVGPHNPEWGERFPDMSQVYSKHFSETLHSIANLRQIRAMDGIYAYAMGPCYETPAEVQAYKTLGADVVGMSTVPEAVFAKACGMQIAGISLVTNLAAGISRQPLKHEDVVAAGEQAKSLMSGLIDDFILRVLK